MTMAYLLYWKDYWKPEYFLWDENYHVASAARYLKGVFFMEPHPPLGKLLLALSEWLIPINNGLTYNYEAYDIIPHAALVKQFSFAGYRFLPAITAILNIFVFAGLVYWISRSYIMTASLSMLPLLDTALIIHTRAAMLDSFLLFGELVALFAFLYLLKINKENNKAIFLSSTALTIGFVIACMTKVFGLALLMLWPLLYFFRCDLRPLFNKIFLYNFLLATVLCTSIWAVHIELGKKIVPSLYHHGIYRASSDHERWLLGHEKDSCTHLPQKILENIRYMMHYGENVAPLDRSEKNVTGSYPITWPFGSQPIIYRWEKTGDLHRYLYLIPNPWTWAIGLAALLLCIALWIRRGKNFLQEEPEVAALVFLYFCYILPMSMIKRVLYLYHYFPMLFITWILAAYVYKHFFKDAPLKTKKVLQTSLIIIPLLCFHGYYVYRGLIHFSPLSCRELEAKKVLPFWGLKFPTCEKDKEQQNFLKGFKNAEP